MQVKHLRALMEFAEEVLISTTSSKDKWLPRFASSRSDLFRHHSYINLRNRTTISNSAATSCLGHFRHIAFLIRSLMGE